MKRKRKNKKINPVTILILLLGLTAGLLLIRSSQEVRRPAYYGQVSASLLPSERDVLTGETFNLRLKISPGDNLVSGVDLDLDFDSSLMELTDVEVHESYTGGGDLVSDGKVNIMVVTVLDPEDLPQESFDLAVITFKAIGSGTGKINRVGDYQIVGSRGEGGDIDRTLELVSFNPATVNISEGNTPEGGWPVLNFSVKFGGTEYAVGDQKVIVDVPDQKVKLVVKRGGFRKEFDGVDLVFDDQAIGWGSVELVGVTPGGGYAVLIKGPVHLARKFCSNKQKERCQLGEENISLVPGDNNYDWTGLNLEPGDINLDGRVDSTDFSRIKSSLGNQSGKEDINFNGIVNSQDIVLLLDTLNTKYEEEI